ncbi:(d)CMP kinase, partial [Sphingomonas sp.]|uniref:(d)CMP kinase n=1 Tax=Sphingomonas sp. TaxID=28214 RepID=UPI00286E9E19
DEELRSEAVSSIASRVSAYPAVRAALLERQREFAAQPGGAVLDGRDIGTVVAPNAHAKLYVTASPEVRARRRVRELLERGMPAHYDDVLIDIRARDARDSTRDHAPLAEAPDAAHLDTSDLDKDAAIAAAIALVEEKLGLA